MKKVNLDALIPREDFDMYDEREEKAVTRNIITVMDLKKDQFFYPILRKPDFQRETNEWDIKKVVDLITCFIDGDLIPAVILWKSRNGNVFVVDGSHRLSALISWVNDDYGDGSISKSFYDTRIPDHQITIAEATRKVVKDMIGAFADFELGLRFPERVTPNIAAKTKNIPTLGIQVQWVIGDSTKAEGSFFKINQQATPINSTELNILKARRKPNGIAARAIVRSGKGHKYWSAFSENNQKKVEELSAEVNELLFNPDFSAPVKTVDLPIGGDKNAETSLPLILDLINIVNNVKVDTELVTDDTGDETIKYLQNCKKVLQRINSAHPGSLGLHPLIYFYSNYGRHKTASFFAILALVLEFERLNTFKIFTDVRSKFEELLLQHNDLIQQIVRKYRGALESYLHIRDFYLLAIDKLASGFSIDSTMSEIMSSEDFNYLAITDNQLINEDVGSDFSKNTKSKTYITAVIPTLLRCQICQGYIHKNSISIDHIERKQDGGKGNQDNAQLTHPYCNTTYKN